MPVRRSGRASSRGPVAAVCKSGDSGLLPVIVRGAVPSGWLPDCCCCLVSVWGCWSFCRLRLSSSQSAHPHPQVSEIFICASEWAPVILAGGVSPSFGFHCYRLIEGGLVEDEEFPTMVECLCEGFEVFIRVVFHRFTAGYLLVLVEHRLQILHLLRGHVKIQRLQTPYSAASCSQFI